MEALLGGAVDGKEAQNKKIPFGGAFGCSGGDFFAAVRLRKRLCFFCLPAAISLNVRCAIGSRKYRWPP